MIKPQRANQRQRLKIVCWGGAHETCSIHGSLIAPQRTPQQNTAQAMVSPLVQSVQFVTANRTAAIVTTTNSVRKE
jgi:hypothetical protein